MKLFQNNQQGHDPVFDNILFSHYLPLVGGAGWNLLSFMIADSKDFYAGTFERRYTLQDFQRMCGFGNPAVRSTSSVVAAVHKLVEVDLVLKRYTFEQREVNTSHGGVHKVAINTKFSEQLIYYRLNTNPKLLVNQTYIFVPDGSGNYTTMPRALVEEVRPELSNKAWQLVSLFMRNTWGFRKETWQASFTTLKKLTAIKDNKTLYTKFKEISEFRGQGLFKLSFVSHTGKMVKIEINREFEWENQARENSQSYPQNICPVDNSPSYPQFEDNQARENSTSYPQARENSDLQARENSDMLSTSAWKFPSNGNQARENSSVLNTESLNTDSFLNKEKELQQQQQTAAVTNPLSEKLNDISQAKHEALKLLGISNKYGEILDKLTANEAVTMDMVNQAIDHKARFKKQAGLYVKFLKGEVTLNWEDSPLNDTSPKLTNNGNNGNNLPSDTPPWEDAPPIHPIWQAARDILAEQFDQNILTMVYGARAEVNGADFTLYADGWLRAAKLQQMGRYIHKALEQAAGGAVIRLKIEEGK